MSDILIIGHGVVGKNLERELESLSPNIYDKYIDEYKNVQQGKYKIAFVCVDTPQNDKFVCDVTEVKNAIVENDAEVYVIKSTILPGTTDRLALETKKRIVFSPEYYGGTPHCNNFDFDFTILGGETEDCKTIIQTLQRVYDARHTFRITTARTAELTKYMENSFLATKISFCGQFYLLAEQYGVDYEELRELFILDPRVNPSHTFIFREHPYWDSHCLNKDVAAIAFEGRETSFLNAVINFNEEMRKR